MVKVYGIDSKEFEQASREEIYAYFANHEEIEVDTETTGYEPYTCSVMCLQLGDFNNQFVISGHLLSEFKAILEAKTLLLQNAKFDLKFLYKANIWPTRVWDTFLCESLITCGLTQAKRGLGAITKARLNVDLDKSIRANIGKLGLVKETIQYAADDVKYLGKIKESQLIDIEELGLHGALDMENRFVIVLAYIEFCGFKLDESAWKAKMTTDITRMASCRDELNKFVIDNGINKFIDRQLDLFSDSISTKINWASSKQVVELFKTLGIPIEFKIKGELKESVDSKYIEKYTKDFPVVKQYLDYKGAEKVVSTYGESFLKAVNPITRRIHTDFRQIMDTGRISSGNKKTGSPNLQNIPRDRETRGCFISEPGRVLGICDYSGQEQIILANKSLDKNILKFYDEGGGDMHSFIAKAMFPELKDLSLEEIKKDHSEKRYESKVAGFVVNYGGCAINIAEQLNKTIEVGEMVFKAYFEAFPDLKYYFEKSKQEGLRNGYILISKESGRKSFIEGYEGYLRLREEINSRFWDKWALLKRRLSVDGETSEYLSYKEKISTFFKIKGAIERKSLNFPTQGTAAEITKLSAIFFFDWIRDNNLINKVLMVNQVHDENIIEAPEDIIDISIKALGDCMVRAGEVYCKRVPLKADPVKSIKWEK